MTEFRGRGDQIHVYPLSFKEYYETCNLPCEKAYEEYQYYGGMPFLLSLDSPRKKKDCLKNRFSEIYIKDITERNRIQDADSFEKLLNVLASSVGSYTNPTKLENTFKSVEDIAYGHVAIKNHIEFIKDTFLISEAKRYDIKGKNTSAPIPSITSRTLG